MLGHRDAVANLAVKNIDTARTFYEEILGLTRVASQDGELVTLKCGTSMVNVYRSEFAGTNKATAVTWSVGGELDGIVDALRAKGIVFEHYDMPGLTRSGDIHVAGPMKVVWFKDPDGNILNLIND